MSCRRVRSICRRAFVLSFWSPTPEAYHTITDVAPLLPTCIFRSCMYVVETWILAVQPPDVPLNFALIVAPYPKRSDAENARLPKTPSNKLRRTLSGMALSLDDWPGAVLNLDCPLWDINRPWFLQRPNAQDLCFAFEKGTRDEPKTFDYPTKTLF